MATKLAINPLALAPADPGATDPLCALEDAAGRAPGDFALLHSGPATGFSVLGREPLIRLLIRADGRAELAAAPGIRCPVLPPEPLAALEALIRAFPLTSPHPLVGWLGFISYDIGRTLEHIPDLAADDLHWPLLCFTLFGEYRIFDRRAAQCAAYRIGPAGGPGSAQAPPPGHAPAPAVSGFSPGRLLAAPNPAAFERAVLRAKEYIAAGDIYQANLAGRWAIQTAAAPVAIFRRLCEFSPASYSACLRFSDAEAQGGTRHVLSASPELLLCVDGGRAVTRPIKGTRPRDLSDGVHDVVCRNELQNSEKDRAELAMIVDLLRNDLGRVCRFGSVEVTEPRAMEQHPTLWHTAATIEGELRPDAGLSQILAALCPGGSITGAPKIRAMQIIEELEPTRRGLYCGNIGVIGPPPNAETTAGGRCSFVALNIAIRTIQMIGSTAYVHAGAGIVADSDPAQERQETRDKAAALLRALGMQE